MVDDADQNTEPEWLKHLPIRSEEIGFEPGELVACAKCGKSNAPNRATCLYCGMRREGFEIEGDFELRELEDWENGFNVVLLDARGADLDKAADAAARIVQRDRDFLKTAFESGKNIPLVRTSSDGHAQFVCKKLGEAGVVTRIVEDAQLNIASLPIRLRSISFNERHLELKLFNIDESCRLPADELVLIVVGTILEGRHESVERRKMRGTKMLNESAISSDEPVVDIYSNDEPLGWRIPVSGFDFSCLDSEKSLLASENMNRLIAKLAKFAPNAKLIGDYASLRSLIDVIWPPEVKRERSTSGFGRKDISTVRMTNNAVQFTKYSRLLSRLLYEEKV